MFTMRFLCICLVVATVVGYKLGFPSFKKTDTTKSLVKVLSKTLGIAISSASLLGLGDYASADSRLNAPSAAGTRVNSDEQSLLRYGLPIDNKILRDIQASIESAKMNLRTRRPSFARSDLKDFKSKLDKNADLLLKQVPQSKIAAAKASLAKFDDEVKTLEDAITAQEAAGAGSLQERKGLDDAFLAQDVISREYSTFEECFVPDTFVRKIPEEYSNLPVLQGRATVEMVVQKADKSQFDVDGKLYNEIKLVMVLDGYNAPITAGNIVELVNNGFYNGKKITRSDGFVIQTGDANAEGEVHGYVPKGATEERKIPLEISIKGDKEILYGITTEDDGRGYVATVLPFQSTGALGMARTEFEPDSASSQFFWLLFESDLTPAGKNLLDGRYTCFGYTIEGADLLKGLSEGDVIASAKVVSGLDKLVLPKGQ